MTRELGFFALACLMGACSPVSLAVPERSRAARFDLKKAGWQESALCTFSLRKPCVSSDEQTNRPVEEVDNAKTFLGVIGDSAGKPFRAFQDGVRRLFFIKETKGEVIDALEEKPDSSPGRVAYVIHGCWFVVYSKDKQDLYTKDPDRALVSWLTIFCKREKTGP